MQSIKQYLTIFENLNDGIYFVDINRQILFWNKGAERITGYSSSEVLGKYCNNNILKHADQNGVQLCYGGCPLHESIWDNQIHAASVFLHHKEGYRVPVSVKTIPLSENGKIVGAVEVFHTHSESFEGFFNDEELKALALKDPLTNLPNRRYVEVFLKSKINEFESLGIPFGILYIDIDHFKNYNDQYGHDAGDEALRIIAKTLSKNVRSTDLVGRWGGEEFLGGIACSDNEGLLQVAEKIRVLVENSSIDVDNQVRSVTVSIGATLYRNDDTFELAIKRADNLLYLSKTSGKNRVTVG